MDKKTENAFLPAALEIQETPPSPAGRAILWAILACFVLTLIWASVGNTDIVSVAQGRIIASGHSKTVQPLEIGTVKAIHVSDGQAVDAGEVLIELDPSSARADVRRLEMELQRARQDIDRLHHLANWTDPETGRSDKRFNEVDALLVSQWGEFQDRLNVLARERDSKRAERDAAQRQVDKLSDILPIISRRAENQRGLAEKKMLPEQQYLETEQERLETYHDRQSQKARVAELDAGLQELGARLIHTRSEFRRQILERTEEADRRASNAEQELVKARTRLQAQTIVAPVDGVVQQLAVHSVGAIVTPAQELMVIVPGNARLEVEAMLENKDIGFVEVGQQAEIKIDTFPFTKYGTIEGEVVDLSNDAVADERMGLVYKMRVLMKRAGLMVNGREVALAPGMTVTVESKTGTRRLIEFFLSPLLRYADESVRER